MTILILLVSSLISCSISKSKKNSRFKRLMEEQLGMKELFHRKESNNSFGFIMETDYKITRIDTLLSENAIIKRVWIIESNRGELQSTTTDLQGRLTHFYGLVFVRGQRHGNYTDTYVDSLGESFTEWGITEIKKMRRRSNRTN